MPFLPPNQHRQSTEGKLPVTTADNTIMASDCQWKWVPQYYANSGLFLATSYRALQDICFHWLTTNHRPVWHYRQLQVTSRGVSVYR